jgi:hypothetical protein
MKGTRRVVKDVACGNNCTVLLVGAYRTPKLTELCLEAIAADWAMYEHIGASTDGLSSFPFLSSRVVMSCLPILLGSPPPRLTPSHPSPPPD